MGEGWGGGCHAYKQHEKKNGEVAGDQAPATHGPVHSTPRRLLISGPKPNPVDQSSFTHKSNWATYAKRTLSGTGKPPRKHAT